MYHNIYNFYYQSLLVHIISSKGIKKVIKLVYTLDTIEFVLYSVGDIKRGVVIFNILEFAYVLSAKVSGYIVRM